MTNPELERKRGEFEKWACKRHRCCLPNGNSLHTLFFGRNEETGEYQQDGSKDEFDAWLSSQQSTLRRVRAVAEKVIAAYNVPLLEAAEKGFGDTALYWSNKKAGTKILLAAIEREFEGCSCGSHDLAPLYHHPKCALAPAAPSERADRSLEALWTEFLWQDSQGNKSANKAAEAVAKRFAEFVSSQAGK